MIEFGQKKREYLTPEWMLRGNLRWAWGLWEPLNYYKRLGIRGNFEWLDEWYLHAHEKETIKKLSEAGINCITTHFFKGFGLKIESKEIERMRELTRSCHEYGIKVFAYIQAGSLMYESFLDEIPEAKDWMVCDAGGKKKTYSNHQYWRWIPCLNNSDFQDYIRKCVDRAVESGADGVHVDNLFPRECYCSRCQQDFRLYLKENASFLLDEFNYDSFDKVEIPPEFHPGDPLGIQWRNFNNDVCLKFMRGLYEYIKKKGDIAFSVNGYTFAQCWPGFCDYMEGTFVETTWHPRLEDNRIVTQYHFLNRANTLDLNAIPASYDFSNGGNLYFPTLPGPDQIKRNLAESALSGGHAFASFWAMLPDGRSSKCAFEDKQRYEALKSYNSFFAKYKHLIKPRKTMARTALMHSYASFSLGQKEVIWEGRCMQQFCIENQIDYDVIFSEDLSLLDKYDLLLLPDICCMSNAEIEKIKAYIENGGFVIATRRTSLYDENFKERRDYGLADIFGCSYGNIEKELYINTYGSGQALFFPAEAAEIELEGYEFYGRIPDRPVWADKVVEAIENICPSVFIVRLNPRAGIGTKSFELEDGAKTVHLLNFADSAADNLEVRLADSFGKVRQVELYTPDDNSSSARDIPFEYKKGNTHLTVPKLQIYSLLLIKCRV